MARAPASDVGLEYDDVREFARRAFVTGTAVMLPIIVTLIVLGIVVNFVSKQLDPLVGLIASVTGIEPASEFVLKVVALVSLVLLILVVGALAEHYSGSSEFGTLFSTIVSRIPGIGSLYRSLDEMTGLLLDDNTESFREVKLVEFPAEGSYAVAFLTADTPEVVRDVADGADMVTLFLPLAPNPVMGGYVLHVSADRVYDVDLTVEEGIRSIVTSGVATGVQAEDEFSEDVLDQLDSRLEESEIVSRVEDLPQYARDASDRLEETARERMGSDLSEEPSGEEGGSET